MKKGIKIAIIFLLFLTFQPSMTLKASQKLSLASKVCTFSSVKADVNGDGIKETVSLTGLNTQPYPSCDKLKVVICDNAGTKILKTIPLKFIGFRPKMIVKDVDNDGASDILVSCDSGSCGYLFMHYSLYTFRNNKLNKVPLDIVSKNDENIQYKMYDADQLLVTVKGLNKRFHIPLSRYQLISLKDKLRKEKGFLNKSFGYFPCATIEISDINKDGLNEIKCRKLFAACYQSGICWVNITYRFHNGLMKPIDASLEPLYKIKTPQDKKKSITYNDLCFNNLKCGLTVKELSNMFHRTINDKDYKTGGDLKLKDGTELFIFNILNNIRVSNKKYCTPRGLKIGDYRSKVIELYGEPDESDKDNNLESITYFTDNLNRFSISLKNNVIIEMSVDGNRAQSEK